MLQYLQSDPDRLITEDGCDLVAPGLPVRFTMSINFKKLAGEAAHWHRFLWQRLRGESCQLKLVDVEK